MRKLKKISSLLLVIICVLSIFFFCIKVCGVIQGARASQEEIIARELTPNEIYRIELYTQLNYNFKQYRLLSRVIGCETVGNPNAKEWNEMAFNPKSNDYGLFQINYKTWNNKAIELGFENYIDYWKDNISMGVWIYKNSGIQNWNWSRHCWK